MPETTTTWVFSTRNLKRYRFPTHVNDLVMDRAAAESSEVLLVIVPVNEGPPLHRHDDTEQIFYLLEGRGTLTIGEDLHRTRIGPGDVVRIPRGTLHAIRADRGETVRYLCVDCFGLGQSRAEATWDDHVRAMCRQNGWDYEAVVRPEKR